MQPNLNGFLLWLLAYVTFIFPREFTSTREFFACLAAQFDIEDRLQNVWPKLLHDFIQPFLYCCSPNILMFIYM